MRKELHIWWQKKEEEAWTTLLHDTKKMKQKIKAPQRDKVKGQGQSETRRHVVCLSEFCNSGGNRALKHI